MQLKEGIKKYGSMFFCACIPVAMLGAIIFCGLGLPKECTTISNVSKHCVERYAKLNLYLEVNIKDTEGGEESKAGLYCGHVLSCDTSPCDNNAWEGVELGKTYYCYYYHAKIDRYHVHLHKEFGVYVKNSLVMLVLLPLFVFVVCCISIFSEKREEDNPV